MTAVPAAPHGGRTRLTKARPIPTRPRWRSVSVHPLAYALLGLALVLGPVEAAQLAGVWTTSGRVSGSGREVTVTGADPSEIKGWMTIEEVVEGYDVPLTEFYARFTIPEDVPKTTALKDLESRVTGFSVDAVRTWLAERRASDEGGAP